MASPAALPHTHDAAIEKDPASLPRIEDFKKPAEVFRRLGDPSRLRIFWILCHGEECVINISALMNMSSPSIAHHLKLLKMSGLLTSRRVGKEVFYRAADSDTVATLHPLVERMIRLLCPKPHPGNRGQAEHAEQ